MGKKLKYLLVCEGPTDIAFITQLAEKLACRNQSTIEIIEMSPQKDATSRQYPSHGWTEVRNWCKSWKVKSNEELDAIDSPFKELLKRRNWKALIDFNNANGIIIQMDTDIAEMITDLSSKFSTYLGNRRSYCNDAILYWLGETSTTIDNAYILLPSYAIETWLLATHSPNNSVFDDIDKPFNYEDLSDVEKRLITLGYSSKKVGATRRLRKKPNNYTEYANTVYEHIEVVKKRCAEANIFCDFLESNCT